MSWVIALKGSSLDRGDGPLSELQRQIQAIFDYTKVIFYEAIKERGLL